MKEKTNIGKIFIPLIVLLVSFVGVTVFSMIYMAKDNNYDNVIYQYFNISKEIYGRLIYLDISKNVLTDGMNLCSLAFLGGNFLLFWSICSKKEQKKRRCILAFGAAYLLLQAVIYSDFFQKAIYFGKMGFLPNPMIFKKGYEIFHKITVVGNFVVLASSCILMMVIDLRREPIPEVRRIKGTILLTDISLICIYFYMYFSLPDAFLWMSRSTGYIAYDSLKMPPYVDGMRIITWVVVAFLAALFFQLYRYEKMQRKISEEEYVFSSIIASSEISTRAFSHYIKNELLGIMAEAELIASESVNHEKELSNIQNACRNIYDRLNELQRNTNRIILNQSRQNLADIITQAVEENRVLLEKEGCSIVWNNKKEYVEVFLDADYMKEVFRNIFKNALEAMRISEENKKITIQLKVYGDIAVIEIADTGPGISEAVRGRLFEPFVSTKSTKQNWGIGLYFCKRIISSQRGKITAGNQEKGGAVIHISLPLTGGTYGKNKSNDCR